MAKRIYSVGDKIWYATFEFRCKLVVCPVCAGKLKVTLILGDDSRVILDCDFCSRGYDLPRGKIETSEHIPRAEQITIERVDITTNKDGSVLAEYSHSITECSRKTLYSDCIFDTEEEAMYKVKELQVQWMLSEAENSSRRVSQARLNNKYTWAAGYHIRQNKEHREKIIYHENAARILKEVQDG